MILNQKNILTVGEHDTIHIADHRDISKGQISYEDVKLLTNIDFNISSKDKQIFKHYGRTLKTQSFVGSIQVDKDLIIEILPKFIRSEQMHDDATIKRYRETLMHMILLSKESKSLTSTNVSVKGQNGELPMFETLIYFFADALAQELRKGLHREYIKTSDNLNQMKGRLIVHEHLRRNLFNQAKLYVEYETFSIDNPLMQIFKSVLRLLLQQNQISMLTKQKLNEALYLLNDVSDIRLSLRDFESTVFHRMNSRFEDLFNQCKFLIMKFYPFSITSDSKTKFWAILFDMDELFEKFISYLFDSSEINHDEQFRLHAYKAPYGVRGVGARPDYVFYKDSNITAVGDAKWKLYDSNKTSSSDMGGLDWSNFWQLTSYMHLLSDKPLAGYFIVPAKHKDVPREIIYQSPNGIHPDITVLTIDLTLSISEILQTHRFYWDNNRLRLKTRLLSFLWLSNLIEELSIIREEKKTSVIIDDAINPCLSKITSDESIDHLSLISNSITADKNVFDFATKNFVELSDKYPEMETLPLSQAVASLIKNLEYVPEKKVEVVIPYAQDTQQIEKHSDNQIDWFFFQETVKKVISKVPELEYINTILPDDISKILDGTIKPPLKEKRSFSIDGQLFVIFSYTAGSLKIRIEVEDVPLFEKHLLKYFSDKMEKSFNTRLSVFASSNALIGYLSEYIKNKELEDKNKLKGALLLDEVKKIVIGKYNPTIILKTMDKEKERFEPIYSNADAFAYFITHLPSHNNNAFADQTTIIERFVDRLTRDDAQISETDKEISEGIMEHVESYPQAFKKLITRRWALENYLEDHVFYMNFHQEVLLYIIQRLKSTNYTVTLTGYDDILDATNARGPKYNDKSTAVLEMASWTNLSNYPPKLIEKMLEGAEKLILTSEIPGLIVGNTTTPEATIFDYWVTRSFYKSPNSVILRTIDLAETILQKSPRISAFMELLIRVTENFKFIKINLSSLSQQDYQTLINVRELVSKNHKLFFLWRTLINNVVDIDMLDNIMELSQNLSIKQKEIVYNAIAHVKVYKNTESEDDIGRYAQILHKILLDEISFGKDQHLSLIIHISRNYLLQDETEELLFEHFRDVESVRTELLRYAKFSYSQTAQKIKDLYGDEEIYISTDTTNFHFENELDPIKQKLKG